MEAKIVADSGCDLTLWMKQKLDAISVPLTMILGQKEYVDDESLDLRGFMSDMKACKEKVGSAAPSPLLYRDAFARAKQSFAVTLSSQLSGSYANACIGKTMAEEENGSDVHIFDSKSASAGELLIALKIRDLIDKGFDKANIISSVERFIKEMKTYFVLESYDNLQKNGRLNKITGKIINVLNIKLVMGADEGGNIALFSKVRGTAQMLERMLSLIAESGKKPERERLVITHCNNLDMAERLSAAIKSRFNFSEVLVVHTGGLASLYTDDGGIVMAF